VEAPLPMPLFTLLWSYWWRGSPPAVEDDDEDVAASWVALPLLVRAVAVLLPPGELPLSTLILPDPDRAKDPELRILLPRFLILAEMFILDSIVQLSVNMHIHSHT